MRIWGRVVPAGCPSCARVMSMSGVWLLKWLGCCCCNVWVMVSPCPGVFGKPLCAGVGVPMWKCPVVVGCLGELCLVALRWRGCSGGVGQDCGVWRAVRTDGCRACVEVGVGEGAPRMRVGAWLLPALADGSCGWSGMKGCVGEMERADGGGCVVGMAADVVAGVDESAGEG